MLKFGWIQARLYNQSNNFIVRYLYCAEETQRSYLTPFRLFSLFYFDPSSQWLCTFAIIFILWRKLEITLFTYRMVETRVISDIERKEHRF